MKKEFSTSWKASKRPGKQRKYLAKAPLHLKRKFVSVNLSKELRSKYGRRVVVIRKGDTVKIMRGKFADKTGKVISVTMRTRSVGIEGMQIKKQDGSKVDAKFQPSNLQITELYTGDSKRNLSGKKDSKEKVTEEKHAPKKTRSA